MVSAWLFRVTFFVAHESISLAAIPRCARACAGAALGADGRSALPRCAGLYRSRQMGLAHGSAWAALSAGAQSRLPRYARGQSETVGKSRRSAATTSAIEARSLRGAKGRRP